MSRHRFTDAEEYRHALMQCYLAVSFIVGLPLDDLHDAQAHAEAVGPFMDPTLWIQKVDKLNEDRVIVDALRKVVAALPAHVVAQMRGPQSTGPPRGS